MYLKTVKSLDLETFIIFIRALYLKFTDLPTVKFSKAYCHYRNLKFTSFEDTVSNDDVIYDKYVMKILHEIFYSEKH
jgi:hypothetical protein